jgi:hypothetical protein
MSLVVDLGLERFCHGEPDRRVAIVEALVKNGTSKLLREVVAEDRGYTRARILEVTPTATTWLGDKVAAPIRADLAKALSKSSYDSYSWDELEEMGARDIQELALPFDGPRNRLLDRIEIDADTSVRVIDLDRSERNWPKRSLAYKLHVLAKKHRLIVHSA